MKKINYVIATWSGSRLINNNDELYYENVLRNHLKILDNTPNSISQITIMKPHNNIKNTYYDIVLNDKIKIVECENKYQSYGQWMKAADMFLDDFDYFIFIEDDYVPVMPNFDQKLIDMYEEQTYLCGLVFIFDNTSHYQAHASISNGIISSNTLRPVIRKIDYDNWFRRYGELFPKRAGFGNNYQIVFSRYLEENVIFLKEYAQKYKAEFYNSLSKQIVDETRYWMAPDRDPSTFKSLISPIQAVIKME